MCDLSRSESAQGLMVPSKAMPRPNLCINVPSDL